MLTTIGDVKKTCGDGNSAIALPGHDGCLFGRGVPRSEDPAPLKEGAKRLSSGKIIYWKPIGKIGW
ncbi:MAG: hypothetical protein ABIG40_01290 [Parcubacteria group bacterium]